MAANHPNRSKNRTAVAASTAPSRRQPPRTQRDADYDALLPHLSASFASMVGGEKRLFTTDADPQGLWDAYLGAFRTGAERQHHDCNCCRRFIQRFGGLVAVDEAGNNRPVMWWNAKNTPGIYADAFTEMSILVSSAKVTGVFLTRDETWGWPQTGEWQHLAVVPPAALVHRGRVLDPYQAAAAVRENVKTVSTALAEYGPKVLDEALRLLEADAFTRSEKFVGPVRWLRALHDLPKGRVRNNLLWRSVAMAPEGFCHIKSSVRGPLLDDIVAGVPFAEIKAKHAAKLHPLQYQRPQAAPAAGNIKAAEALVAKLGIAPALERRFARLDELPLQHAIWVPLATEAQAAREGVFGHLKAKQGAGVTPVDLPAMTMTWDKFARTVIPEAEQIELAVPAQGSFYALVTATHADAPPILKWDRDEERNPVSWYTYHRGSSAQQWGLAGGRYAKVNAIMPFPSMWGSRPMPYLKPSAFLVLEGCADTRSGQGNALFPEMLKDDLHGIRSTVEAYSRSAELSGRAEASACGIGLQNDAANCELRALIRGAWNRYSIDRWD
ncbi:hypothetical protein ACIPUD_10575 [Bradyrhizobium sp. CAR08]